jgi:hypothetical protein
MRKSYPSECGLLHATRGECGRFSVRLNHRLIEKQGVNGGLSILSLDILPRRAELATSTSPGSLVCAESATSPTSNLKSTSRKPRIAMIVIRRVGHICRETCWGPHRLGLLPKALIGRPAKGHFQPFRASGGSIGAGDPGLRSTSCSLSLERTPDAGTSSNASYPQTTATYS